jgi:hypothetical protein
LRLLLVRTSPVSSIERSEMGPVQRGLAIQLTGGRTTRIRR